MTIGVAHNGLERESEIARAACYGRCRRRRNSDNAWRPDERLIEDFPLRRSAPMLHCVLVFCHRQRYVMIGCTPDYAARVQNAARSE